MYNYTINKSDNYEVLLKDNEFYTDSKLLSEMYYPGRGVDDYIINFKYDFRANEKRNLEYKYNITAELIGTVHSSDGINKRVWTRMFNILEEKTSSFSDKNFFIEEKTIIDYDYYNNLARAYEETYGLDIDSVLKVRFNVNISEINLDDCIELEINLTNDVTSLEENYEKTVTNADLYENQSIDKNHIPFFVISICIVLFIALFEIAKQNKRKTEKGRYKSNVKYILKYYNDIIVRIENKPNIEKLKIMKVNFLDDLIKVADQNKTNIIYYETIKDKKSILYVIINEYCYIYNITGEKLK